MVHGFESGPRSFDHGREAVEMSSELEQAAQLLEDPEPRRRLVGVRMLARARPSDEAERGRAVELLGGLAQDAGGAQQRAAHDHRAQKPSRESELARSAKLGGMRARASAHVRGRAFPDVPPDSSVTRRPRRHPYAAWPGAAVVAGVGRQRVAGLEEGLEVGEERRPASSLLGPGRCRPRESGCRRKAVVGEGQLDGAVRRIELEVDA
jgi:hypothetical protein